MTQAIAAARMLQATQDVAQARALETAMAVCFMRPYTKSDLAVPDLMFPTEESADPGDRELFELLKAFRDKVFAHSDKEGGRQAGPVTIDAGPEIVNLSWTEAWYPFPRDRLPEVIDLCERLSEEMRILAGKVEVMLAGEVAIETWPASARR
jgi:hypothetical protein